MNKSTKPKVAIIWGKWGPYHYARFNALANGYGTQHCLGVALAGRSQNYHWKPVSEAWIEAKVITLNPKEAQELVHPLKVAAQVYRLFRRERIQVAFVPSYWPARSFAVLLAARLAGAQCVMMNESHAGTEQAKGLTRWIKKRILRLFRAGFVGGTPHKLHFTSLGMPPSKIFVGYDAVDNEYFASEADKVRSQADKFRRQYGLPKHYILNLGRMVAKKNLSVLIEAYAQFSQQPANLVQSHSLVLIGSGPEEAGLRDLAKSKELRVRDLIPDQIVEDGERTVFFGGFRQIDENPIFFALADVFVLPSHTEEWGLVVNEAMACGLPILVSKNVGSALDLVHSGVNGIHFDPFRAEELSRALTDTLSHIEILSSMGIASKRIICDWGCDLFAQNAIKATEATVNNAS